MYMWTHNDTCVSALCLLCYALFSQLVPMPHTTPHTIVMQSWATTHWSLRNGAPSGSSGRRLTKSAALLRGGVAPSSRISFSRSMGWIMFYLFITFYIFFIIFYHLFSSCFSYSRTELVPLRNVCIPCIWVCILSAALIASSPRFCSSSNCSWLGMTALARILTMQVICFPRRPLTSDKQRHKDSFALRYPIVALKKESRLDGFAILTSFRCRKSTASVLCKFDSEHAWELTTSQSQGVLGPRRQGDWTEPCHWLGMGVVFISMRCHCVFRLFFFGRLIPTPCFKAFRYWMIWTQHADL